MPHADDTADLVQRIESGASVRSIAAELNVTERTVRNRLRRFTRERPHTSAVWRDGVAAAANIRCGVFGTAAALAGEAVPRSPWLSRR